mmetsp:Transcript_5936/g.6820  ORF Transcript_5936/g.6820 Transcript_5936/m.6820 type:complete len:177 (+) Transcript_5936:463-993(+)|eukprot:CAMPEP_0184019398 /NCGR_PEP_ID=MMETSP0954-20121128/8729_1 /TAXON_ID=627963 /ORGANISM="Aplanochytrium sp, Strain PBS07" /LENGTH=176 /DNA_ID=CAMNT_0026301059 /DNA_START=457 /DNA_END=987 /DNA_ORIENTATION=+
MNIGGLSKGDIDRLEELWEKNNLKDLKELAEKVQKLLISTEFEKNFGEFCHALVNLPNDSSPADKSASGQLSRQLVHRALQDFVALWNQTYKVYTSTTNTQQENANFNTQMYASQYDVTPASTSAQQSTQQNNNLGGNVYSFGTARSGYSAESQRSSGAINLRSSQVEENSDCCQN